MIGGDRSIELGGPLAGAGRLFPDRIVGTVGSTSVEPDAVDGSSWGSAVFFLSLGAMLAIAGYVTWRSRVIRRARDERPRPPE